MAFSETFLQELKYRADMNTVAERYVNLKKSGRGSIGLCPFHSEKTPSFNVFEDTQSFYCFGCGAGGDVITFMRRIENLDYVDAVRLLAQQFGLGIPDEATDDQTSALRRRILEMNREAAKYFHTVLKSPEGAPGRDYFKKRMLRPETVTGFGLGYARPVWDGLLSHLKQLGYREEEMLAAALVREKDGHYYDQFRNRVIFPIIDLQGNVIAFGGRVLDDSKPKYLNSADTPVFKKSRGLYALNFAKGSSGGTADKSLILCEGYMDVIALHQAGFKNAVATLGTALTPEQTRLMARYAQDIIVSYDADEAGQKAAQRAIGLLTQAGLSVRVLRIEGQKDPDEFIKVNGADKFKAILEKSGSHIEYRLTQAKAKYDLTRPEQKVEYIREAEAVLCTIKSAIEREVYAGRLAEELEVSKETLLGEIGRMLKKNSRRQQTNELRGLIAATAGMKDRVNPEKGRYLRAAMAEESLIVLLYKNPDFLKALDNILKPEDFLTEFNKRVYAAEREMILRDAQPDLAEFGALFTPEETGKITGMLTLRAVSNTLEEARDCAQVLLQEKLLKADNGLDALDKLEGIRQKKLDEKNYRREN